MNSILAAAWIGTLVHGWTGESKRYELMHEAGIGLVRCEVGWKNCEKRRGEYVLPEHVENELKIMKNLGIKVNMLLSYDNPEVYPENPLDPEAFGNWAVWLANRLKPWVDDFEIYNEGWTFGFRKRYGDKWIDEFIKFTHIVADKLHAARPEATVIVASEDGWSALHDMLCKSIGRKGEVVSFHPYVHGRDPRPERAELFWHDNGKSMWDISLSHGGASRLRITEIGWTTYALAEHPTEDCWFSERENYPGVSLHAQARYLIRSFIIARSHGVEAIIQYDFHDDGPYRGHTEHNFGLVFEDYTPKKSFYAIKTLNHILGEAKPLGAAQPINYSQHRLYAFKSPAGANIYAAWVVEGQMKLKLPVDAVGKAIYDFYGVEKGIVPSSAEITLTEDPVYIADKISRFARVYPEEVRREWVLPDEVIGEGRDDWRGLFEQKFAPVVKDATNAVDAVQRINAVIWDMLGVHYSTARDQARQSPFHSMRTGKASCTGMAILQVDAYRSVGIPARLVGCNWTTLAGNHSWAEFMDEKGEWHFFGDGNPSPIDDSWIAPFAAQADATRPDKRIYASRATPNKERTRFWRTWDFPQGFSEVWADDVTERYRKYRKAVTIDDVPDDTNYQKR